MDRLLSRSSPSGSAELALNALRTYFRPERIRFFATSSIGFNVNTSSGTYDPDDFQNVVHQWDAPPLRIRGPVHPINVLEPVLWLAGQVGSGG